MGNKFSKSWLVATMLMSAAISPLAARASGATATNDVEIVPGPLDGRVFSGALGPDGEPKDVPDTFVFKNGTFASQECESRCNYPARPYFVRVDGDRVEFISETKCPYKDATIIWRGTVEGDRLTGKSTWVVKRWYWTIEDTYAFEGRLVAEPNTSADAD
ncbi:MAG TPA: hypothetical protein VKB27_12060 [Gammaproteobacteria bacterium]|nr:hypothetical protein [Gammaproteobacteria bacterium]